MRTVATSLLSNVARTNAEALRLCAERLGDENAAVRMQAAIGMARCGDFSSDVCSALGDFGFTYAGETEAARELLTDQTALLSMMWADHAGLCVEAARVLIDQGWADERVFEALVSSLGAEPRDRVAAARLLIEQGRADEQVLRALVSALGDESGEVRAEAAQLLIREGRADEGVFKALVSSLVDEPWLAEARSFRPMSGCSRR